MRGIKRILLSMSLVFLVVVTAFIFNKSAYGEKAQNTSAAEESFDLPIYSVDVNEKKASITFDINWAENDYLYTILDILDKYNVKGTFFIMGGWVDYSEENVEKLKSISERGLEIGNHSYKHPMFTKISNEKMTLELQKTDEVIKKYTGKSTKLFRFPSGDYNKQAVKVINEQGYIPIQWSADSVDWKESGADVEYERVKKGMKEGSIILFHNNAKYTPENLERIIKEYEEKGYKFVPVGELIYTEDYGVSEKGNQFLK